MQLRDIRGHSYYTLPTRTLQLYKNFFINRCLFRYTVWCFRVSFWFCAAFCVFCVFACIMPYTDVSIHFFLTFCCMRLSCRKKIVLTYLLAYLQSLRESVSTHRTPWNAVISSTANITFRSYGTRVARKASQALGTCNDTVLIIFIHHIAVATELVKRGKVA